MQTTEIGHNFLHLITAIVSFCLFIVAYFAYMRKRNNKFLIICIAFFAFSFKEFFLFIDIFTISDTLSHYIEHGLNLVILILFALGILK